jgi:hypothetical protein
MAIIHKDENSTRAVGERIIIRSLKNILFKYHSLLIIVKRSVSVVILVRLLMPISNCTNATVLH